MVDSNDNNSDGVDNIEAIDNGIGMNGEKFDKAKISVSSLQCRRVQVPNF